MNSREGRSRHKGRKIAREDILRIREKRAFFLIKKPALKEFSSKAIRRLLKRGTKGEARLRQRLGDNIDLLSFQLRMIGALSLSESMGAVLFESGRNHARLITGEALDSIRRVSGYRGIAESKNLEEARLSSEFTALRTLYLSAGEGILSLRGFERDKLIVFRLEECADCYGVENVGRSICFYAGGTLAGRIESALDTSVGFVESKCYAKGDSYCEFRYKLLKK